MIRAPVTHPELGRVRNGLTADVLEVDVEGKRASLLLAGGRWTQWDRDQLDAGKTRLAYVSHPFPAQGRTTDAAHSKGERQVSLARSVC